MLLGCAAMLGAGVSMPAPARRAPAPPDLKPLGRPCPACGAEPGDDCDRRTIGRHPYHGARIQETP